MQRNWRLCRLHALAICPGIAHMFRLSTAGIQPVLSRFEKRNSVDIQVRDSCGNHRFSFHLLMEKAVWLTGATPHRLCQCHNISHHCYQCHATSTLDYTPWMSGKRLKVENAFLPMLQLNHKSQTNLETHVQSTPRWGIPGSCASKRGWGRFAASLLSVKLLDRSSIRKRSYINPRLNGPVDFPPPDGGGC